MIRENMSMNMGLTISIDLSTENITDGTSRRRHKETLFVHEKAVPLHCNVQDPLSGKSFAGMPMALWVQDVLNVLHMVMRDRRCSDDKSPIDLHLRQIRRRTARS